MGIESGTRHLQRPIFSKVYLKISDAVERNGAPRYRRALVNGLSGQVVEVGPGNGLGLVHYSAPVTKVVAVEPDDLLRSHARLAAARAEVEVEVVDGHADALALPDESCDAAVVSLMMCSVPDPAHALQELRRVLRPGGELRFFEHVRSDVRWVAFAQTALTPITRALAGGCHFDRDLVGMVVAAGFELGAVDRFRFAHGKGTPAIPHVLGVATKPVS
ncbi:class I SAM-dependent methyltransferase [Actinokineospora xionganensis]|uniref:Class I SAM-dependent methyltransferase n=1 Tax=Actinokineospora xionganensis TaxID=2684470 RepID=A0ABR7KZW3_9PSEU|nr:class I SAM-dependent methyltransferase [Actinokineospora xionganensis]MBC6445960.1 class I SAM-dependent methyltransferase [Actinokineospora xionganensis]